MRLPTPRRQSSSAEHAGGVAPADPARHVREQAIAARAREFDATALLDALADLGYHDREIVLRSRHGSSRAHSLFDSIAFEDGTPRRAVVTVNLGLLGSETPLPSYMAKLIERSPERLIPFFEFFDHKLLRSRLRALWPERDRELGSDWPGTRQGVSKLMRLDTPVMAHWLFGHVYPELQVAIRRDLSRRTITTQATRMSRSSMGDGSTLGGVAELSYGALIVTLVANDARCSSGAPWQEEAVRRLKEQLLPRLRDSEISLTVTLIIRDEPNMLRLAPNSFLGLQPLQRGRGVQKALLFDGPIRLGGAATTILEQPADSSQSLAPSSSSLAAALVAATAAPAHGSLPAAGAAAAPAAGIESYLERLQ